ncbi:MAG: methylenetetrahydrofolate reductase [NAD(P)H] [Candidatus Omnitrophota bacterium]
MRIDNILKISEKGFSFEFFPPKTETGKERLKNTINTLRDYKPLYVSMTYGAQGGAQDKTKEAVSLLLENKEITVMPHLTCINIKEAEAEALIEGYKTKGIENIMALRGDPPQGVYDFDYSDNDLGFAIDLIRLIKRKFNCFCIGCAVYPEGHIETSSLDEDIEYTKQKIEAGSDFAVTQMFFDNSFFYSLRDRLKKKGISIPVLPGILPLTSIAKIKEFASVTRVTIPKKIEQAISRYENNPQDALKAGIDKTILQCRDLIKNGAKRIHFFTLNKPSVIETVLDGINL